MKALKLAFFRWSVQLCCWNFLLHSFDHYRRKQVFEISFRQISDIKVSEHFKRNHETLIVSAQFYNSFGYCPSCLAIVLLELSIVFCNFINLTAHHLGQNKPSSTFSKELLARAFYCVYLHCGQIRCSLLPSTQSKEFYH